MFSCEYCEIFKNRLRCRTPVVAALGAFFSEPNVGHFQKLKLLLKK